MEARPFARAVALITSARPPSGMDTAVVAVDGFGGAGKSTLAGRLREALGCRLIQTDDFASWDDALGWWPRMIDQVLEPLSRNTPGRFQRYDWERRTLAEWHDVPVGGILLLEGVSSSRVAFRPYLAASIWVQTPREERLRRGLDRDGADAEPLWKSWMAAEDAWAAVERPTERADLVLRGY